MYSRPSKQLKDKHKQSSNTKELVNGSYSVGLLALAQHLMQVGVNLMTRGED